MCFGCVVMTTQDKEKGSESQQTFHHRSSTSTNFSNRLTFNLKCIHKSVRKMATLSSVISLIFSVLLTPFLVFLLAIVFLASLGKSLGVRRLYIKCLLTLFEVRTFN